MNITLIGMPGSGKSFIGKKLAERLGYALVELDQIMEGEYGSPLQQILDQLGEDPFLEKQEMDAIAHTTNKSDLVISPGGSIVYTKGAMEHLKSISTIMYLKAPLALIEQRIGTEPRGIVRKKEKTLAELYDERTLLYEHWAMDTINADQDAERVIADILLGASRIPRSFTAGMNGRKVV
ncbi:MAG: shikimate kinase [bacterium]|nr:shikimate kinase [bacterium]